MQIGAIARKRQMHPMIPTDPNTLLTRKATATALTEAGYPTRPATLATKATRGGGPPYHRFGLLALYKWGKALEWAQSRLSPPIRSTSEAAHDARRRKPTSASAGPVAS